MEEAEWLTRLIGDIYDATLDGSLWPDTLKKAAGFIGGANAAVWSMDAASKAGEAVYWYGFEQSYVDAYFDEYVKLDPSALSHVVARPGEPIAQSQVSPNGEFHRTRFYREWSRPQGIVDCMLVTLDKSATTLARFSVSRRRRDGPADAEMARRMRFLTPHLRRASLIGRAIDFRTATAQSFSETLDGLSVGMFLVDAGGRIVHANAAGRVILADDDIVRLGGGRLVIGDMRIDAHLRTIFAAAAQGDAAIGTRGIVLTLTARTGERHIAHVLPLASGARRRVGMSHLAVASVFVRKAALDKALPLETIAKAYKLSPMELRILLAIVEVGGAPDVADVLGIAPSTVRTHLRHVYEKTGTARQVDLVKLAASFLGLLGP